MSDLSPSPLRKGGPAPVAAMVMTRPVLRSFAADIDKDRARQFALDMTAVHRVPFEASASIADIIAGAKPGCARDDDVFIFDSTGMALQGVAAACVAYERAIVSGKDDSALRDRGTISRRSSAPPVGGPDASG